MGLTKATTTERASTPPSLSVAVSPSTTCPQASLILCLYGVFTLLFMAASSFNLPWGKLAVHTQVALCLSFSSRLYYQQNPKRQIYPLC